MMTTTTTHQSRTRRVSLGRLVMTRTINNRIASSETFAIGIVDALRRHARGDWGEVCREDATLNDLALRHDERILSAYTIDGEKVWIITEWDRSYTTILYPHDY